MTKNTSQTDEVPKASEVPRSETDTSFSSLLDPQDSTDTRVVPTQPSQTSADSTQSGPTVDDESEENKAYVRGYNDALADLRGAHRSSAPQAPRSPKAPSSSDTELFTGTKIFTDTELNRVLPIPRDLVQRGF